NATLELLHDLHRDKTLVNHGEADLEYVHLHRFARGLAEHLTELFHLRAALADHDAGLRRVDRHGHLIRRALDLDARDRRVAQARADRVADRHVFFYQRAVAA